MSNFLQQLFGMSPAGMTAHAPAAQPATMPAQTPAPAAQADPATEDLKKMAALSSVNVQAPTPMRAPQTPLPQQAGALNPEIMRIMMQGMQGTQGQLPPSLGAILAGRA